MEKFDWYDHATETMWAQPVGNDLFQLRNVPFYAYGLSYDDVVEVSKTVTASLCETSSDTMGIPRTGSLSRITLS